MVRFVTRDEALEIIRSKVTRSGSQRAFASEFGLSTGFVCDVLRGRKGPSKAILNAVGLELAIRPIPKPSLTKPNSTEKE